MKRFSKNQLTLLVLSAVFTAVVAHAYTLPLSGPTGNNTEAPITVSSENQIKNGGFAVNNFLSRSNALLEQNAIFNGTIRGGQLTDETSTVSVTGDTIVTGSIRAGAYLQAGSLAHSGGDFRPLCSGRDGVLVFCSTANMDFSPRYPADGPDPMMATNVRVERARSNPLDPFDSTAGVSCSVTLNNPARSGGELVSLSYAYVPPTGGSLTARCTVPIPAGEQTASVTDSSVEVGSVTSYCAESGTVDISFVKC